MPTQDQQQELFTTRAARLRLLDRVQLPKTKGTLPSTMKALLRAIDGRAREKPTCKVGIALLAEDVGCDRATIYRTLAALRSLALLEVIRSGRANIYRIGWANLVDFDPLDENGFPSAAPSGHDAAAERSADEASCDLRSRTMRHQKSHRATSEVAPCDIVRSASLSALEPPPPPARASGEAGAWEEVEEILRGEFQISRWRDCIADSRRRGETPDDAIASIAEFREGLRTGRFEAAGALYQRLSSGVWPPPTDAYAKAQARSARLQASLQRTQAAAAASRADDEESAALAALEAAWGPALDALDDAALRELGLRTFAANQFLRAHFRTRPRSSELRVYLLRRLAREEDDR